MRILYAAAQAPISPHYRGGSSAIYYEQLASLCELGHELHLWHFAYDKERAAYDAFVAQDTTVWAEVSGWCRSVTLTTLPRRPSPATRLHDAVANRLGDDLFWPHLRAAERPFRQLLDDLQPDLVWAQHLRPALIATRQTPVATIYSHLDWLHRIKALRNDNSENGRLRRVEHRVARRAAAVTSGNLRECRELTALGARHVAYIPVAYRPAAIDLRTMPRAVRLVHFGGLATTATRVGLERFFERVWPALPHDAFTFYCVGDTSAAGPTLRRHLTTAVCPGHVTDWPTVLRPFDIHVIPWEYNTGQRTRLPVAFNFGQAVVAVRAGIAGYPEAVDGVNCRLVDSLDEMVPAIAALLADPAERRRLGRAARQTFEQSFTRPALLPRYEVLLTAVTTNSVDALSVN